MVQIQIDFNDEEDRVIEIYKATERLETKKEAVIKMVRLFGKLKGERKA